MILLLAGRMVFFIGKRKKGICAFPFLNDCVFGNSDTAFPKPDTAFKKGDAAYSLWCPAGKRAVTVRG